MKHSNLTYRDKILKWFDVYPNKINSLCEDNLHIFDWIYGGYCGKISAKIDLTIELINRKADLNLIKLDTFKEIVKTFIGILDSQEHTTTFVLQSILKQKNQLNMIKKDFSFLNQLILSDLEWDSPNRKLKNLILYSDIENKTTLSIKNDEPKVNYSLHPIAFLMQHYFLYLHEFRNHDTYTFLKINKIHELNEELLLSKIYFELNNHLKERMSFISLVKNDHISEILIKIKCIKESKINNFNSPIILPTIKAIEDTVQRDLYRNLELDLKINKVKKQFLKI
jgi:hypothetical protein